MNWIITIYVALLFFVLCPGILVSLPPKRGKFVVAAVHALIFALVWHFTYKFVWRASMNMMHPADKEGLTTNDEPNTETKSSTPEEKAAAAKKRVDAAVAEATKRVAAIAATGDAK